MARQRELLNLYHAIEKAIVKAEKLSKEYPKKLEEDLNEIGKSVITEWYATYEPHVYNRLGSLYHSYEVIFKGTQFRIEFDSSLMWEYNHHQSDDIIFENSFILGFHGGSYGQGMPEPFWRTPIPYYTEWYRSAVQSFSPYEKIYTEMNNEIKKYKKDFQEVFDNQIIKPLLRSFGGVIRK